MWKDNEPWKLGGHSSLGGWEWPPPLWPPRFKMSPIPFQSGDFLAGGGLENKPAHLHSKWVQNWSSSSLDMRTPSKSVSQRNICTGQAGG